MNLYTPAEAAAILNVSLRTLQKWLAMGDIPFTRLGPGARLIRIRADDLMKFVERGTQRKP
ncbi:MAG: helix-turn-helix domain-containing protein [Chloroflexi bacterium]|nr:helix-turn-helix domain-containing protein [Chloroflexota bacterium]